MLSIFNCQECKTPCFDFEETGLCPREALLSADVCPMFEVTIPDIQDVEKPKN